MKFVFAIASLLFVGMVAAQTAGPQPTHPQHELINDLIKRGQTLLAHSREIAKALRDQGKGHLLQAVEHELIFVEALVLDLQEQQKHVTSQNIHHIHILEEDLLFAENRLSEEFHIIINELHLKPQPNNTTAELIARGEKLIKQAQEVLDTIRGGREARAIEHELAQVQHLLREVQIDPNHSSQHATEQLARHEHTLNNLIQRAKAHGN